MPNQKYDINSKWFHEEYLKKYEPLHGRIATSKQIHSQIVRCFFEFIREQLYKGEIFGSIIGTFKIIKVNIQPKLRVSHAGTNLANQHLSKILPDLSDNAELIEESILGKEKTIVYRSLGKKHYHTLVYVPTNELRLRYKFKVLQKFSRSIYKHYE